MVNRSPGLLSYTGGIPKRMFEWLRRPRSIIAGRTPAATPSSADAVANSAPGDRQRRLESTTPVQKKRQRDEAKNKMSSENLENKIPNISETATLSLSVRNKTNHDIGDTISASIISSPNLIAHTNAATTTNYSNSSNNNNSSNNHQNNSINKDADTDTSTIKKPCWRRRTVHFTVFLAVFSTILSLLWIYTVTFEWRKRQFDANMTQDYVLHIPMDNPQLVAFIRDKKFNHTTGQEPLNATKTPEEDFVIGQLQNKRDGVYFEFISRQGATSTTAWLEKQLGWRGVMVFTDFRNYFDAYKSSRNPKTRVLHACLSLDNETKEITYHQETDVQVTKLGESPNSIVLSKESLPATRLFCFPLYTILLAYNTTTVDYMSFDSTELQEESILNSIPWNKLRISILSIHWGNSHIYHSESEMKTLIARMSHYNYKFVKLLDTGKMMFLYNRQGKILKS